MGDVLTVNLVIDYSASMIGEETIQDAARAERHCWLGARRSDFGSLSPAATFLVKVARYF